MNQLAYANLFMAELEEKLLDINYLNSSHPTIKFTSECSETSADFLDITIYKGERFKKEQILDVKP